MSNPDPVEEVAKVIAAFREDVETGHQLSDREVAEKVVEAYREARSPFAYGRTFKRADFVNDNDCAVVLMQTGLREMFIRWLAFYGLEIWQMPSAEDDVALFATRPKDLAPRGDAE